MYISRAKVGRASSVSRTMVHGGLRWTGSASVRKESAPRLRLTRSAVTRSSVSPEPVESLPNIVAPPLSFISVRNFCLLAGLAAVVIMLIWSMVQANHQAVNYGYEISDLTQKRLHLLEVNRNLNMDLARQSALPQLEARARENGLIIPQKGQIVVID